MLFTDYVDYEEIVCEKEVESFRKSMMFSSFSAWQILKFQGYISYEWNDYLQMMGLVEKEIYDPKEEAKKGYAVAENILKKYR